MVWFCKICSQAVDSAAQAGVHLMLQHDKLLPPHLAMEFYQHNKEAAK